MGALDIHERNGALVLRLRVKPKARRAEITGAHGGALKLSVCEAPERGQATSAVLALLADRLGLPRASVVLLSGATSQDKVVAIRGVADAAALEAALLSREHSE